MMLARQSYAHPFATVILAELHVELKSFFRQDCLCGSDSKSEFSLLEVQVNLKGNNILRSYRAQLFVE
jgi:hypothetical protein